MMSRPENEAYYFAAGHGFCIWIEVLMGGQVKIF